MPIRLTGRQTVKGLKTSRYNRRADTHTGRQLRRETDKHKKSSEHPLAHTDK